MDQHRHWNQIAPSYEDEIFDVFKSERNKLIPKLIGKYARKDGFAIDFGCGVGKAFPLLSPSFANVMAIDISEGVIDAARQKNYPNLAFKRADLSSSRVHLPEADFVFCCNVIMLPEISKDWQMFRNFGRAMKKDGHGAIVVPSLESIFYASWRLMDRYRREGVSADKIPSSEFHYFKSPKRDLVNGIMHIDGVPTKHYSQEELRAMLPECGLEIISIQKLEYDWNTEFAEPPPWMGAPYPWDWIVELGKGKKSNS